MPLEIGFFYLFLKVSNGSPAEANGHRRTDIWLKTVRRFDSWFHRAVGRAELRIQAAKIMGRTEGRKKSIQLAHFNS